jgi:uncharacterized protein YgbK (DUF1537 family)
MERGGEEELIAAVLANGSEARIGAIVEAAIAKPEARLLARQIYTELVAGGAAAAASLARQHRRRIEVWR